MVTKLPDAGKLSASPHMTRGGSTGTLLTGNLVAEMAFFWPKLPARDSLLRQREDRAGRSDAAQEVLAKRDQPHCSLGGDCA